MSTSAHLGSGQAQWVPSPGPVQPAWGAQATHAERSICPIRETLESSEAALRAAALMGHQPQLPASAQHAQHAQQASPWRQVVAGGPAVSASYAQPPHTLGEDQRGPSSSSAWMQNVSPFAAVQAAAAAGSSSANEDLMREARKSRVDALSGKLRCLGCGKVVPDYARLAQHLKDKHSGVNVLGGPGASASPSQGSQQEAGAPTSRTLTLADLLMATPPARQKRTAAGPSSAGPSTSRRPPEHMTIKDWRGVVQAFPDKTVLRDMVRGRLVGSSKKKLSRLKRVILRERADKNAATASAAAEKAAAAVAAARMRCKQLSQQLKAAEQALSQEGAPRAAEASVITQVQVLELAVAEAERRLQDAERDAAAAEAEAVERAQERARAWKLNAPGEDAAEAEAGARARPPSLPDQDAPDDAAAPDQDAGALVAAAEPSTSNETKTALVAGNGAANSAYPSGSSSGQLLSDTAAGAASEHHARQLLQLHGMRVAADLGIQDTDTESIDGLDDFEDVLATWLHAAHSQAGIVFDAPMPDHDPDLPVSEAASGESDAESAFEFGEDVLARWMDAAGLLDIAAAIEDADVSSETPGETVAQQPQPAQHGAPSARNKQPSYAEPGKHSQVPHAQQQYNSKKYHRVLPTSQLQLSQSLPYLGEAHRDCERSATGSCRLATKAQQPPYTASQAGSALPHSVTLPASSSHANAEQTMQEPAAAAGQSEANQSQSECSQQQDHAGGSQDPPASAAGMPASGTPQRRQPGRQQRQVAKPPIVRVHRRVDAANVPAWLAGISSDESDSGEGEGKNEADPGSPHMPRKRSGHMVNVFSSWPEQEPGGSGEPSTAAASDAQLTRPERSSATASSGSLTQHSGYHSQHQRAPGSTSDSIEHERQEAMASQLLTGPSWQPSMQIMHAAAQRPPSHASSTQQHLADLRDSVQLANGSHPHSTSAVPASRTSSTSLTGDEPSHSTSPAQDQPSRMGSLKGSTHSDSQAHSLLRAAQASFQAAVPAQRAFSMEVQPSSAGAPHAPSSPWKPPPLQQPPRGRPSSMDMASQTLRRTSLDLISETLRTSLAYLPQRQPGGPFGPVALSHHRSEGRLPVNHEALEAANLEEMHRQAAIQQLNDAYQATQAGLQRLPSSAFAGAPLGTLGARPAQHPSSFPGTPHHSPMKPLSDSSAFGPAHEAQMRALAPSWDRQDAALGYRAQHAGHHSAMPRMGSLELPRAVADAGRRPSADLSMLGRYTAEPQPQDWHPAMLGFHPLSSPNGKEAQQGRPKQAGHGDVGGSGIASTSYPHEYECEVCHVVCCGHVNFEQHCTSKKHLRKAAAAAAAASLCPPMAPSSDGSEGAAMNGADPASTTTYVGIQAQCRNYCMQVISTELNRVVVEFLQQLLYWQERSRAHEPIKAQSKKRLVSGLREVAKAVRLSKAKTVVVAPNIEQIESEGGLDDLLTSILQQAEQNNIPIVFALSRKKLGQVFGCRKKMSAIAILDYSGAEAEYRTMTDLAIKGREDYARHHPEEVALHQQQRAQQRLVEQDREAQNGSSGTGPSTAAAPLLYRTRADGTRVPLTEGAGLEFARRKGLLPGSHAGGRAPANAAGAARGGPVVMPLHVSAPGQADVFQAHMAAKSGLAEAFQKQALLSERSMLAAQQQAQMGSGASAQPKTVGELNIPPTISRQVTQRYSDAAGNQYESGSTAAREASACRQGPSVSSGPPSDQLRQPALDAGFHASAANVRGVDHQQHRHPPPPPPQQAQQQHWAQHAQQAKRQQHQQHTLPGPEPGAGPPARVYRVLPAEQPQQAQQAPLQQNGAYQLQRALDQCQAECSMEEHLGWRESRVAAIRQAQAKLHEAMQHAGAPPTYNLQAHSGDLGGNFPSMDENESRQERQQLLASSLYLPPDPHAAAYHAAPINSHTHLGWHQAPRRPQAPAWQQLQHAGPAASAVPAAHLAAWQYEVQLPAQGQQFHEPQQQQQQAQAAHTFLQKQRQHDWTPSLRRW